MDDYFVSNINILAPVELMKTKAICTYVLILLLLYPLNSLADVPFIFSPSELNNDTSD